MGGKDAVQAHKKAVEAMGPNFVTPLKNHEEVTTALAKMFAAAPADKIKAVFDATPGRDGPNDAWYAQMPKADADATFVAAKGLADAAYPLVKSIDWANTGVLDSYLAKTPANKEAILALLNAGLAMDPKMVQGAVRAHLDAVSDVDGSLVTS